MGNVMLKKDIGQKWGMCRRMKKAVALFLFVILIVANIDKEMILGFAVDSDGFFDSYTIVGNPRLFGIDDDSDDEHGWNPLSQDQRFTDAGNGYYMAKFTCIFAGEYEFKIIGDGDFLGWNAQLCFGNPDTAWSDNQSTLKVKLEADEYTVVMNPSQGLVVCVQNGKVADFSVRYKSRDEDSVNFVEPSVEAVRADGYDPQDFDANLAAFKIKALEIANTESVVNIGDRFVVEGLEYEVIGSEEVAVSRLEDQNITDLVIPEKVTYAEKGFEVTLIGSNAFDNCSSLTSIMIPDSVNMGYYPFWGCSNLEEIKVSDKNEKYISEKGVLFDKDKTTLIRYPAKKKGEYKIPEGVTWIAHGAFEGCSNLINVIIPESVTGIGDMAFCNCINLTSIIIPDSVTNMSLYLEPYEIFYGCNNLTIYSTENSYAHSFALEYGISWAPLTVNPSATIEILEGKDMQYIGTGDYILRLDKEPDKFMDVLIDGIPVDPSNYTVTEGSTIITFSENYLRTLQEGEHIIKVNFTDGYADTTLTILSSDLPSNKESAISENNKEAAAKTGDEMSSVLLGVLFTSVVTAVIVSVKKKISN